MPTSYLGRERERKNEQKKKKKEREREKKGGKEEGYQYREEGRKGGRLSISGIKERIPLQIL